MRYWEIHEARMGKRDFSAARGSEVLVGFEFEIAHEIVPDPDPRPRMVQFEESPLYPTFTMWDWTNEAFPNMARFIDEFALMPKEPVTYGEMWEINDGDEDSRPDDEDEILDGFAWSEGQIKPFRDYVYFEDVERDFYFSEDVGEAYDEWVDDKIQEAFEEWDAEHPEQDVEELAKRDAAVILRERTGLDIHLENDGYTQWFITTDCSIKPQGVELVSPPLPVNEAIASLHRVLDAIYGELMTNSSTGLHINVSVPDPANIDLLKLLLFMAEKHVLQTFGRDGNGYTISLMGQVRELIPSLEKGKGVEAIIRDINEYLLAKAAHHFSIDVRKLKKGYLEFRPAGGAGYEDKGKEIEDTVLRFVRCIELASDVNAERKSYLRKLSALIQPKSAWEEIGFADEANFRAIMENDPSVEMSDITIRLDALATVLDFLEGTTFNGEPRAATKMALRKLFGAFGDQKEILVRAVKSYDIPWMAKLLK